MKRYRIGPHPNGRDVMVQWTEPVWSNMILGVDSEYQWFDVTEIGGGVFSFKQAIRAFKSRLAARLWIDQELDQAQRIVDNQREDWEVYPRERTER